MGSASQVCRLKPHLSCRMGHDWPAAPRGICLRCPIILSIRGHLELEDSQAIWFYVVLCICQERSFHAPRLPSGGQVALVCGQRF